MLLLVCAGLCFVLQTLCISSPYICSLLQELPRVQERLETLAAAWEEREGRPFLVHGQEVPAYLDGLWGTYEHHKEMEKAKRVSRGVGVTMGGS